MSAIIHLDLSNQILSYITVHDSHPQKFVRMSHSPSVLQFSLYIDDRQALLAHMERYIAGINLDAPDTADSTTEDTPVKTPPSAPKKSKQTKKKAAIARKESSVARAKSILASINFSDESSSSEDDAKDFEIKRLKKELEKMKNQRDSSVCK